MPIANLNCPAHSSTLDVLIADRDAIDAAITSLRHRIASSGGRAPFELGRYLDAAVERRAEVAAEIANHSVPETTP